MKWLWVILVCGCGGAPFEGASSLSISPDSETERPSNDALAGFDGGARDAGLGALESGEIRGEAGNLADNDAGSASARDVMNDPWPDDVEVKPVNCFRSFTGQMVCCYGDAPGSTCRDHEGQSFCDWCVR